MYKLSGLEVGHAIGNLAGHVHQHRGRQARRGLFGTLAQVVQQVAPLHELRDDVERGLAGAHACNTRTRFTKYFSKDTQRPLNNPEEHRG